MDDDLPPFPAMTITFRTPDDPFADEVAASLQSDGIPFSVEPADTRMYNKSGADPKPLSRYAIVVSSFSTLVAICVWLGKKGFEMFGKQISVEISPDGSTKITARSLAEVKELLAMLNVPPIANPKVAAAEFVKKITDDTAP